MNDWRAGGQEEHEDKVQKRLIWVGNRKKTLVMYYALVVGPNRKL